MEHQVRTLVVILSLLHYFVGYRLLKFKGYNKGWYLLLLIAQTPLFWLIAACMTSRNKQVDTGWASVAATIWAILVLGFIVYVSNHKI